MSLKPPSAVTVAASTFVSFNFSSITYANTHVKDDWRFKIMIGDVHKCIFGVFSKVTDPGFIFTDTDRPSPILTEVSIVNFSKTVYGNKQFVDYL